MNIARLSPLLAHTGNHKMNFICNRIHALFAYKTTSFLVISSFRNEEKIRKQPRIYLPGCFIKIGLCHATRVSTLWLNQPIIFIAWHVTTLFIIDCDILIAKMKNTRQYRLQCYWQHKAKLPETVTLLHCLHVQEKHPCFNTICCLSSYTK